MEWRGYPKIPWSARSLKSSRSHSSDSNKRMLNAKAVDWGLAPRVGRPVLADGVSWFVVRFRLAVRPR